ncbi:m-phase inducer phosphatase [Conglomerata obtusa]
MCNPDDDLTSTILSDAILTSEFLESVGYDNSKQTKKYYNQSKNVSSDKIVNLKRKNSVSILFSSELSSCNGYLYSSIEKIPMKISNKKVAYKDNEDKSILEKNMCYNLYNINFLNYKKNDIKKSTIFDSSFLISDDEEAELEPTKIDKTTSIDDSFIFNNHKIANKNNNNFSVYELPPFNSHWALKTKKKIQNFSVPSNPKYVSKGSKTHLIDFWHTFDTGVSHSLPTIGSGHSDSILRVSVDTVSKIIKHRDSSEYVIIDCRFEYEYNGGHLINAKNINSTEDIDNLFDERNNVILIFHCEYSSIRAPRLARYLRNKDRNVNKYPNLSFPEIYVMEGGYKKFFEDYSHLCEPMFYVSMDDKTISSENTKRSKKG